MRRLQALLVVVAMLAAPLALTARIGACPMLICCLVARTATTQQDAGGLHCDHDRAQAASSCKMAATCGGRLDYGLASLLPALILPVPQGFPAPRPVQGSLVPSAAQVAPGFNALPFEPPRA